MSTKETYLAAKAKIKAAQEEAKATASIVLKEMVAGIFEKYQELAEFSWTQYTPFFADGDVPEFSAHISDPNINGEETPYFSKAPAKGAANRWLYDAHKDIKELLKTFDNEDYKAMFGDHVLVTVSQKNGVEVEDYDHE